VHPQQLTDRFKPVSWIIISEITPASKLPHHVTRWRLEVDSAPLGPGNTWGWGGQTTIIVVAQRISHQLTVNISCSTDAESTGEIK